MNQLLHKLLGEVSEKEFFDAFENLRMTGWRAFAEKNFDSKIRHLQIEAAVAKANLAEHPEKILAAVSVS